MISTQMLTYAFSSGFMLLFGWLSGRYSEYYSGKSMKDVYVGLNMPSWAPPGWIFGVVWTTLYILMGIGLATIINSTVEKSLFDALDLRAFLIVWFVLQYAINFGWSIAAAGLDKIEKSKWLTALLAGFVIAMTVVSTIAGHSFFAFPSVGFLPGKYLPTICFFPYALWTSFATVLHWTIASLNPGK
jgi:tryptophan-rich sensory protein